MTLVGQQIGHYKLLRSVGSGGMGEVYLAEDTRIYRQVAVKIVRESSGPGQGGNNLQEAARSFLREAQAIAILDHPNILPLFDFGEQVIDGTALVYLVTPFRQEGSLAQWLQQRTNVGQLSLQDVVQIVRQAASALQFAHSHGIIHQDVKPSNFLLRTNPESPERPDILLADFGVAKLGTSTTNASQTIRGTPTYMAPEQWEGRAVPATDQYALAVMTYEMLTGRPPFQGTPMRVMYLHNNAQPEPPSIVNPRLPQVLDAVLLRALAKRPEERYPSVYAFAQAFQQALESQGTGINGNAQSYISASTIGINDIRATLAISQQEAQTGTQRTLTLPDGREVQVAIPSGVYDGQVLHIPNGFDPSVLLLTISISSIRPRQTLVFPDTSIGTSSNGQTVVTDRGRTTGGNYVQPPYNSYPAEAGGQRSGGNWSANEMQQTMRNSGNWGAAGAFPAAQAANNTPDWADANTAFVPPVPPLPPGSFTNRPSDNTRNNSSARIILLIILALLIIGASGGFIYFAVLGNHGTGTADAAATAQAQAQISINATGTSEASAVAGAANNATATAITAANNQANATATANADATSAASTATGQGNANATATAQSNANATATAVGQGNANATATAQTGAGATATAIAGATATVVAQATATVQTTAQYDANWVNDDSATKDITHLIITNTGQTLNVHGFGACSPTDCDWGTRSAVFNGEPFVITFVFPSGAPTTQLTITFNGDTNHLKVVSVDSAAGTIVNYMHRG